VIGKAGGIGLIDEVIQFRSIRPLDGEKVTLAQGFSSRL
jgi:hypothetical protein